MLSYRPGTVNDVHWRFKPVLSYSKPHIFSTFFGLGLQSALQEPPLSACQAYLYGLPRRLNSTSPPTSNRSSSTAIFILRGKRQCVARTSPGREEMCTFFKLSTHNAARFGNGTHILHTFRIKYLDMASSSINFFSLASSQRIISKYKAKMAIA